MKNLLSYGTPDEYQAFIKEIYTSFQDDEAKENIPAVRRQRIHLQYLALIDFFSNTHTE